ncbi:hypothetical protein FISHEDRAFT_32898 [Fistulina hepatica ATCC 64428]|uniref:MIOS-like alpha-solenoid domain-containing protein n=1 Tax=Fistulina hepatica ATCC 64428 TaxID=1128425 RepID=A0A0D7AP27_9AGAR|nr:hypothetical protein FISHEDRAFT_32898 [Fistulina hepatica ATCC 64428]
MVHQTASQSERRLLWNPRQNSTFAVGSGTQITLYECSSQYPQIKHITSQHDLQYMKCFAWSPDPLIPDLFAVGLSTGRVNLVRLEASKQAHSDNVLSSGPHVALPVKPQRSCNALAFSYLNPNYLAVGLDKVRGDNSLVIWDIHTSTSTVSLTPPTAAADSSVSRPSTSRDTLPVIARTDVGTRTDSRILQQHASAEAITALSFLPDSAHLLLAGAAFRWLRLYDLRVTTGSSSIANVGAKVQGIATDPFDPHRVITHGDGVVTVWDLRKSLRSLLSFGEKHAMGDGATTQLNPAYVDIEMCRTRRGVVATLERDSHYVRFWDILEAHSDNGPVLHESALAGPNSRRSWATNLSWGVAQMHSNSEPTPAVDQFDRPLILADTHRSKIFSRPLSSFAVVPSEERATTCKTMVVNHAGEIELYTMYDTPQQIAWSNHGDLVYGDGHSYHFLYGSGTNRDEHKTNGTSDDEGLRGDGAPRQANLAATRPTRRARSALRKYPAEAEAEPQSRNSEDDRVISANPDKSRRVRASAVDSIIKDDICIVMKRRCQQGYGLGSFAHNADVTRKVDYTETSPTEYVAHPLEDLWTWMKNSHNLFGVPNPRVHGYDFTFRGLLSIWESFEPTVPHSDVNNNLLEPMAGQLGRRTLSPADDLHGDFEAALEALVARRPVWASWSPSFQTNKLLHRQLALTLCDWTLQGEDLLVQADKWEHEGKQSRAACWLVFTGHRKEATDMLLRSDDEAHHMMSGTLAALSQHFHSSGSAKLSSELLRHCERLIIRLRDPYFRVLLTYLSSRDWLEVLDEELLPFSERLAIAFQFLDDNAVSTYLQHIAGTGNIDALAVTGLSSLGMDLLQNYVDRTGDVQTAAVLGSYVDRWRVSDPRIARWIDTYRELLDSMQLYHHRVGFDIDRGRQRALYSADLPPAADLPPRQIIVRCNYCNKDLSTDVKTHNKVNSTYQCAS